jgi:uncharacterized protein YjdB
MRPAKHTLQVTGAAAIVVLFILSVGCNGFFVDPTLTSVTVSPVNPAVAIKKTVQLSAFGTYDDGSRKTITSGVAWSSSAPTVATIDQNSGIATGVSAGTTTITASDQGLSGTATLTVVPSNVTAIIISPTSASIPFGTTQQFTAKSQDGVTDLTSLVTWSSNDTTDVTISSGTGGGLATSITTLANTINVTITASLQTDTGTVTNSVQLTVHP